MSAASRALLLLSMLLPGIAVSHVGELPFLGVNVLHAGSGTTIALDLPQDTRLTYIDLDGPSALASVYISGPSVRHLIKTPEGYFGYPPGNISDDLLKGHYRIYMTPGAAAELRFEQLSGGQMLDLSETTPVVFDRLTPSAKEFPPFLMARSSSRSNDHTALVGVQILVIDEASGSTVEEVRLSVDDRIRHCGTLRRTHIGTAALSEAHFQFPAQPGDARVDLFRYSSSTVGSVSTYIVWNEMMPDDANINSQGSMDTQEIVDVPYDAFCLNQYPEVPT